MRTQTFTFQGTLPTMNEILSAQATVYHGGKSRRSEYTALKERFTADIAWSAIAAGVRKIENYPVRIGLVIYTKNRRSDPDNIAAGTEKMVLDGLKQAKILRNDRWSELVGEDGTTGPAPRFLVDAKRPRVEVVIEEP